VYLARVYHPPRDHTLVRGTASPLDPALAQYWQQRRIERGKALTEKGTWKYQMGDRQRWLCRACGMDLLNGEDLDQHHKMRVADDGPDHLDNLELLHEACHYNDPHQERVPRVLGRRAV
jgi:RNA-directed DNA polymerase